MEKRGVLLLFSLVLVALLFVIPSTEGRVVHQTVNSGKGLKFLAKFCFSTGKGNVSFQSWHKGSSPTSDVLLLGFDDESSSWPAVYGTGMSCNEQRQRAKWFWPVGDNQIEKITTDDHVEPRYWYIALSRCTGGDYELEYRAEFLQGGGFWEDQFSYDKWALMGLYMGLFIAYFLMLVIQIRIVIYRISHGELSHLHRLFTLIVIVYEVSFLSSFIHNAVYAGDGIGAPGLDGFGEIMEICGEILFVGLVLVMARGWLVTTTELRGKKTLIAIFSVFLITYIAFFIWENVGVDLETNNNVYESVPGIINLVVRFIIWIFFTFYIVTSLLTKDQGAEYFYQQGAIEVKWEPEQRRTPFFVLFGLLITNWFLILPFFVLVSLGAPEYNRVKVIEYIYYLATFLTHCVFVAWFFFKQHGPVEGGSSLLGGLSQDDKVHTSNALDAPATLPSSNPFVSSFSNFRGESAPIRGSKGIELKTRDSKKENSTFDKGEKETDGLYDNL